MAKSKTKRDVTPETVSMPTGLASAFAQAGVVPLPSTAAKEASPAKSGPLKFHEMVKSRNFVAKLRMEKGGRGGKTVTVIDGLPKNEAFLIDLVKTLKTKCGAGGTHRMDGKDGIVEIQGEHRERIYHFLKEFDFQVKGWPA